MPLLETIERGLLFRLTRLVALLLICILAIAIVVVDIKARNKVAIKSHVSPAEVLSTLTTTSASSAQSGQEQIGISLPSNLQKYFNTADNMAILERHLAGLNEAEREEYISNLSEVVAQAELQHADVVAAINRYFQVKNQKLANRPSETERAMLPIYTGGAIFGMVLLIAVLSLVLVLLAIERNTRRGIAVSG